MSVKRKNIVIPYENNALRVCKHFEHCINNGFDNKSCYSCVFDYCDSFILLVVFYWFMVCLSLFVFMAGGGSYDLQVGGQGSQGPLAPDLEVGAAQRKHNNKKTRAAKKSKLSLSQNLLL